MDNVKPCWKSWINLIKENLALGEIRLHAHQVQELQREKWLVIMDFSGVRT